MRAVCQRVSRAQVTVDDSSSGAIDLGLVVLLGVARGDSEAEATRLAHKVAHLRIFEDAAGKFAHSLLDVAGAALVVSQFTLIADTHKGHRPSFTGAAPPDEAEPLYDRFCEELVVAEAPVQRGAFGARMAVELVTVTIVLD